MYTIVYYQCCTISVAHLLFCVQLITQGVRSSAGPQSASTCSLIYKIPLRFRGRHPYSFMNNASAALPASIFLPSAYIAIQITQTPSRIASQLLSHCSEASTPQLYSMPYCMSTTVLLKFEKDKTALQLTTSIGHRRKKLSVSVFT